MRQGTPQNSRVQPPRLICTDGILVTSRPPTFKLRSYQPGYLHRTCCIPWMPEWTRTLISVSCAGNGGRMCRKQFSMAAYQAAFVPCLRALCIAAPSSTLSYSSLPIRHTVTMFGPLAFVTSGLSLGRISSLSGKAPPVRMLAGWGGGTSAAKSSKGSGKRNWDSPQEGGTGESGRRFERGDHGGRGDSGYSGMQRRSPENPRGGFRSQDGSQGNFRGRGRDGGWGRPREEETREELWERRREQQAVQAERQSWLQIQNEKHLNSQYLFGVSPVLAALKSNRRAVHVLFVQETMDLSKRKDKDVVAEIERLAEQNDCEIVRTDKGRLNVMSGDRPHQGLVLQCQPLDFVPIQALDPVTADGDLSPNDASGVDDTKARPPVWLVLDEVKDPQNFGALLRSAYFLGCTGVVTCSRNSASLSPSVSKASAGAMELMQVHSANNLMRFLETSRGNGWRVVGAAVGKNSRPAAQLSASQPTCLVLGNEGSGLRTNILRQCDELVQIEGAARGGLAAAAGAEAEMAAAAVGGDGGGGGGGGAGGEDEGGDEGLDSLNVSVAGGILLHRLLMG